MAAYVSNTTSLGQQSLIINNINDEVNAAALNIIDIQNGYNQGTQTAPSIRIKVAPNTGFYFPTTNSISFVVNNVISFNANTTYFSTPNFVSNTTVLSTATAITTTQNLTSNGVSSPTGNIVSLNSATANVVNFTSNTSNINFLNSTGVATLANATVNNGIVNNATVTTLISNTSTLNTVNANNFSSNTGNVKVLSSNAASINYLTSSGNATFQRIDVNIMYANSLNFETAVTQTSFAANNFYANNAVEGKQGNFVDITANNVNANSGYYVFGSANVSYVSNTLSLYPTSLPGSALRLASGNLTNSGNISFLAGASERGSIGSANATVIAMNSNGAIYYNFNQYPRVNGANVFTVDNDGSGSLLDSDFLDGQHGAYYANITARLGYTPANLTGDTYTGLHSFNGQMSANVVTIIGGTTINSLLFTSNTSSGNNLNFANGAIVNLGANTLTVNTANVNGILTGNAATFVSITTPTLGANVLSSNTATLRLATVNTLNVNVATGNGATFATGNFTTSLNTAAFTATTGAFTANVNTDGSIQAGVTTLGIGGISLSSGLLDRTGSIAFFTPSSYRAGYIGYGNGNTTVNGNTIDINANTGYKYNFNVLPTVAGSNVVTLATSGAGSTLDADLLDGQQGAFYQNANNLTTGILPNARISGSYDGVDTFTANRIRLLSTSDASNTSTAHGFQIGLTTGANIIIDTNEIISRNNGALDSIYINATTIGFGGTINGLQGNFSNVGFGSTTSQMLNLYTDIYGVGVQGSTLYLRSAQNFAVYSGGIHNNSAFIPGTGGTQMIAANTTIFKYMSKDVILSDDFGTFGRSFALSAAVTNARVSLGFETTAPGAVGLDVLASTTTAIGRNALGFGTGVPGAAGLGLLTQTSTANARSYLGLGALATMSKADLGYGNLADLNLTDLFYSGSSNGQTNFPRGSYIICRNGGDSTRNTSVNPRLAVGDTSRFELTGSGTALDGTWMTRGTGAGNPSPTLMQRI